jgi:hypothetical protein
MALLSVAPEDALESLPGIRRSLLAAGNPLSAAFWDSAETILDKIADGDATVGDVHSWLEATGTEPTAIIGLHVWDEPSERSPLQNEMHTRLVTHLEEQLAADRIDPDLLAEGDTAARQRYLAIQEQWMTSPLPDGRVPMNVLLDEQDEQLFADWAAADREASEALGEVLRKAGRRPVPQDELTRACERARAEISGLTADGRMLAAFGGVRPSSLPASDEELWLTLAAGVVQPEGDPSEFAQDDEDLDDDDFDYDAEDFDDELDPISQAMAAVAALDHFDWLAVISALVAGGPGTPASAADLAGYVRQFDPDADDGDEDIAGVADEEDEDIDDAGFDFDALDDELAIEGLFMQITPLWQALGAIGPDERLTALGWWGLPEALKRVWSS